VSSLRSACRQSNGQWMARKWSIHGYTVRTRMVSGWSVYGQSTGQSRDQKKVGQLVTQLDSPVVTSCPVYGQHVVNRLVSLCSANHIGAASSHRSVGGQSTVNRLVSPVTSIKSVNWSVHVKWSLSVQSTVSTWSIDWSVSGQLMVNTWLHCSYSNGQWVISLRSIDWSVQ